MPGQCLTQEQADEFAIGALEPAAQAAASTHLRSCDACLALVQASQRLAATLALSVPIRRSPGHLRERVLRSAGVARPGPFARAMRFGRAAAAVVAVLAAIAAFTGMVSIRGQVDDLRDRNSQLKAQVDDALAQKVEILALTRKLDDQDRRSQDLEQAARADHDLFVAMLSPESDVAEVFSVEPGVASIGRLVWDEDQKKVWFVASRLRELPTGQTYQLWVSSGGGFKSLGTFNADETGFARFTAIVPQGMRGYDTAVVTVEAAGGAVQRTGSSVFVADLSRFRR